MPILIAAIISSGVYFYYKPRVETIDQVVYRYLESTYYIRYSIHGWFELAEKFSYSDTDFILPELVEIYKKQGSFK